MACELLRRRPWICWSAQASVLCSRARRRRPRSADRARSCSRSSMTSSCWRRLARSFLSCFRSSSSTSRSRLASRLLISSCRSRDSAMRRLSLSSWSFLSAKDNFASISSSVTSTNSTLSFSLSRDLPLLCSLPSFRVVRLSFFFKTSFSATTESVSALAAATSLRRRRACSSLSRIRFCRSCWS